MKIQKIPQSELMKSFNKFLHLSSTKADFNLMRRLVNDFYNRETIPDDEQKIIARQLEKLELQESLLSEAYDA